MMTSSSASERPTCARGGRPARTLRRTLAAALAVGAVTGGCDDGSPSDAGSLRFGQVGSVTVLLETPRELGVGELRQELVWRSDGLWTLSETILYDGVPGDTDEVGLAANQEVSASIYREWIAQVNDNPGLDLFIDELDPFLDPTCVDLTARIRVTIRDDARNESISWTRCTEGPLEDLRRETALPDPQAGRVIAAAEFARDRTVGVEFASSFIGSLPFATIDRGEDSGAQLSSPLAIDGPAAWSAFWAEHARSQGTPPPVDFDRDIVLVAAIGQRVEAGDSVEIQSIRAGARSLVVDFHQRVPGNFCSPAEKLHRPFHIVRAPRPALPIRFNERPIQRVPCG